MCCGKISRTITSTRSPSGQGKLLPLLQIGTCNCLILTWLISQPWACSQASMMVPALHHDTRPTFAVHKVVHNDAPHCWAGLTRQATSPQRPVMHIEPAALIADTSSGDMHTTCTTYRMGTSANHRQKNKWHMALPHPVTPDKTDQRGLVKCLKEQQASGAQSTFHKA